MFRQETISRIHYTCLDELFTVQIGLLPFDPGQSPTSLLAKRGYWGHEKVNPLARWFLEKWKMNQMKGNLEVNSQQIEEFMKYFAYEQVDAKKPN